MTNQQRREISAKHIRITSRMEAKFIPKIYNALHAQIVAVSRELKRSGLEDATTLIDKMLALPGLTAPIMEMYKLFGAYGAYKTRTEINVSVRAEQKAAFGTNNELLAEIIKYLQENLLSKVVVPITQTTRAIILQKLTEGQNNGWGAERIAQELLDTDISLIRARLIVRTESAKALEEGRKMAQRQSIYETQTEWIAANDHRTRHSHRDVDGDFVKEGRRFSVPIYRRNTIIGYDFMTGPGDPTASIGNLANCRCTRVTVAKRDEQGRLIRKRNISVILPGQPRSSLPIITI